MSKEINQLQNTSREFNEVKPRVNNLELQVQQNIEDNIAIEIRVNKVEKVQAIREQLSISGNDRMKPRRYSCEFAVDLILIIRN